MAAALSVEGEVYIRGTREPLPQVNIFLLPFKLKATTDENGKFRFDSIPMEESSSPLPIKLPVQWIVNAPGFIKLDKKETLTFSTQSPIKKTLYVEARPEFIFETTIQSTEQKDSVQKTFTKKAAQSIPGAGADPIRAIQNLPGVNRSPGFGSQVIIQGSAPQDTRYTLDGHEIPLIFHFGGLSSVFNPELTESFDYLSAGYQSPYGRAMGGIINLNTRDLQDTKRLKGSVFVDTFNSGVEVETPVGEKGKFAAGARISYIGQVLKAVAKSSDSFSLTVAPSYSDLSLLYTTPLSEKADFKIVGIGSKDSLEFLLNNPVGNDPSLRGNFSNRVGFFRIIPEVKWKHSQVSESRFSLGMGRDFFNTSIGNQYFDLRTFAVSTRVENKTRISDTVTNILGMDHQMVWADVKFNLPSFYSQGGISNPVSASNEKTANIKNARSGLYGFYWNPIIKPSVTSPWTLYPGARVDYFDAIQQWKVGPRVGARYALTPSLGLVAAGGLYAQPPREQEYSSSYGNPSIKAPSTWQAKIAAEKDLSQEFSKGSQVSSGFFGRWFRDLVIPDPYTIYSNQGQGRAIGWENSIKFNMEPWDFWLCYTLSRSTRWDPRHAEYQYQYDQTHFLTLIAGVNLSHNWRIASRFRYVTGPLSTSPTGASGDMDHDVYIATPGALYNTRLDSFAQFDLRVDKRWIYDTWILSLYLDIQNLLNRKNTEGLQYSYDYKTSQNISGLPLLPTFGLKGEF